MTRVINKTKDPKYPTYKIGRLNDEGNGLKIDEHVDIQLVDKEWAIKAEDVNWNGKTFRSVQLVGQLTDDEEGVVYNEYDNATFQVSAGVEAKLQNAGVVPGDTVRISYKKFQAKDGEVRKYFAVDKLDANGKPVFKQKEAKPQTEAPSSGTPVSKLISIPKEVEELNNEISLSVEEKEMLDEVRKEGNEKYVQAILDGKITATQLIIGQFKDYVATKDIDARFIEALKE